MPHVSVEIEKRKIAGLERQLRRKHSRVSAGVCRTCENVTSFDIKVTKDELEKEKKRKRNRRRKRDSKQFHRLMENEMAVPYAKLPDRQ